MGALKPDFDEFSALASGDVTHVPVYRELLADTLTPVSAYQRLTAGGGASEHSFLLESVEGGEFVGRYSFLGVAPKMIVSGRGHSAEVTGPDGATLPGYEARSCVPLRGDRLDHPVAWTTATRAPCDRPVCLCFVWESARLFSWSAATSTIKA